MERWSYLERLVLPYSPGGQPGRHLQPLTRTPALEDRQYFVRSAGRWKLTDSNPFDNGVMRGFLAWANNREFYALLGLKGPPFEALKRPPFEALGIKAANACSDAERQGVKVEFVGLD